MGLGFLQKKGELSSPMAAPATGGQKALPLLKRVEIYLNRIATKRVMVSLYSLLAVLCFFNLCVFIRWYDIQYPPPPLGILTGELLKGFERYSPDDNHTEQVLAEVFGPDIKQDVKCGTQACRWVRRELRPSVLGERPAACANFYEHVCSRHEEDAYPLHRRVGDDLRVAVVDHLMTSFRFRHDDADVAMDVWMLQKCVNSEDDAKAFALACDFSKWSRHSGRRCPSHYPGLPQRLAERVKNVANLTGGQMVGSMERLFELINVSVNLELGDPGLPAALTSERVESFCNWLADSAHCHLRERFKASDETIRRYQKLWNNLFFAPLFAHVEDIALWDVFGDGERARKLACMHTHEGLFRRENAEAATAALNEALGRAQDTITTLHEFSVYMLTQRVPYWLSRHEEGESPRLQEPRRKGYRTELEAVEAKLVNLSDVKEAEWEPSIYSWEVQYDADRNVITVPHGLMELAKNDTDVEPVIAVLLAAPLMRPLLPQPGGPYSWKDAHDQHLAYVNGCFRAVHNSTLDFDKDPSQLRELVYESALLGPLFDLYRWGVHDTYDEDVYLYTRNNNWKLFYVLWALGKCGDQRGGDVVNAVVRNSMRFARTFDCGLMDDMFSPRKCNFWVYW
ncbi:uncharacterized protein LOC144143146 [Haemaphysalis longicornis]